MKIRNRIFLLLLTQLFGLIGNVAAQSDSLLTEFRKTPKTAANICKLIDLSYYLIDYNVDSALNCARQIQQISIPDNDTEARCKILLNLGNVLKLSGKYDESNKYLFQALEIAENNRLISSKIISLYQIGDLNRCIGLLDQSIYYLYLSRNLAHENKVYQSFPKLYEYISSTFYELTEHSHPKFKVTKIPFQHEFDLETSTWDVYLKLCKSYADSALMFSDLKNDDRTKLSCLNILGAYYRQQGNSSKAIEYFGKAIELAEQINHVVDIPNYYVNIARTYFDRNQFEKAIEYGLKGYRKAVEMNILVYKSTAANILRLSYIEKEDFKNALEFQHIESGTREEILSHANWNKISELDKKYQTEQKQKEIEYQKNLLELKSTEVFRRNIIIVFLLVAIMIILAGIFYIQKQKTVLLKHQEEIEAQSKKIFEQYSRLEKLDFFKETLTHALVHDLKNPLSQIMLTTSNPLVHHSAAKMRRLITNMLDVEKYENTGFNLNKEIHSLRGILDEVKTGQEPALMEKNLKLQLPSDVYLVVVDKEMMVRVFDNLLSNAIRFSPQNRNIDVFAVKTGDGFIQVGIKNYGDQIPEEALPFIFDKYRQFAKTDSSSHSSTGLGLTFSKIAIEAHGGKISVRNNPDEGCSFCFTIPDVLPLVEMEEAVKTVLDFKNQFKFTDNEYKILKQAVKQLKDFKIFEISRFHETLDPLKVTTGSNVNEWISRLFSAINIHNIEEYNHLINLIENEQAKNSDR